MKTLVAWLLLSANLFAANFVGTDKEIVQEAERQFQRSAVFWTGKEINLKNPCPIYYRETAIEGGGGATSYGSMGNSITNYKIEVYGSKKYVLDNVVPHETDHLSRAVLTNNQIDNWIGEGCSQLFETPEFKDQIRKRVKFYIESPDDQFSCWNHLGAYQYPADVNIRNFYDTSFTVAEHLLHTKGKDALLEFQKDASPHSAQKWEKYFGEPSSETFQKWQYQYTQPKRIVYVYSDPVSCPACQVFERDKAQGKFTGIEFEYVKSNKISEGDVKYIGSNGQELTKEQGAGRVPSFRVSGSNVVRVGYGSSVPLWDWFKGVLNGPSAAAETVEGLVKGSTKTAVPQVPTDNQGKDAPPVPVESTPVAFEKDRTKALETKVDTLSAQLDKLVNALSEAKDKDPQKVADALKEAIATIKETADTVKETKELKEKQKEIPQEGETPWYLIIVGAILGFLKRRFGNKETE